MDATFTFAPKVQTLRKFKLIDVGDFFVLIGTDKLTKVANIIKLHKVPDSRRSVSLKDIVQEGAQALGPRQMDKFMTELQNKHRTFRPVVKAYAIMGFIRFLKGYYIIMVTKRKRIAKLEQHSLYQVSKIELVPLFTATQDLYRDEENNFVNLFTQFEMQKIGFYFSYTYDLTHSLQENILRKVRNRMDTLQAERVQQPESLKSEAAETLPWDSMFMWNKYHVEDFYELVDCKLWIIPFIHGYISQLNFQDINKRCSVILVSRRSRHYAGTRYLKRGISDLGFSANHVETEQILQVHTNSALSNSHPILSSYVQLRASFPFFWS